MANFKKPPTVVVDDKISEINKTNATLNAQLMQKEMQAIREQEYQKGFGIFWEAYLAKLKRDGVVSNERGAEVDLWKEVANEAFKAIHSEQHAYNDWRSAMMSLLGMLSSLVSAISHSLEETVAETDIAKKATGIAYQGIKALKDTIADKVRGPMRLDLPDFTHNVQVDKDNKLVIGNLERTDGKNFRDNLDPKKNKADGPIKDNIKNLDKGFKTLVGLWLAERGYEPGTEKEGTYVKTKDPQKSLLTKAIFDDFNKNDETSLDTYLKKTVDISFQARP